EAVDVRAAGGDAGADRPGAVPGGGGAGGDVPGVRGGRREGQAADVRARRGAEGGTGAEEVTCGGKFVTCPRAWASYKLVPTEERSSRPCRRLTPAGAPSWPPGWPEAS